MDHLSSLCLSFLLHRPTQGTLGCEEVTLMNSHMNLMSRDLNHHGQNALSGHSISWVLLRCFCLVGWFGFWFFVCLFLGEDSRTWWIHRIISKKFMWWLHIPSLVGNSLFHGVLLPHWLSWWFTSTPACTCPRAFAEAVSLLEILLPQIPPDFLLEIARILSHPQASVS